MFKKIKWSVNYTSNLTIDTWYTVPEWKVFIVSSFDSYYTFNWGNSNGLTSSVILWTSDKVGIVRIWHSSGRDDNRWKEKWFIFLTWERIFLTNFSFSSSPRPENKLFYTICGEEIPNV